MWHTLGSPFLIAAKNPFDKGKFVIRNQRYAFSSLARKKGKNFVESLAMPWLVCYNTKVCVAAGLSAGVRIVMCGFSHTLQTKAVIPLPKTVGYSDGSLVRMPE